MKNRIDEIRKIRGIKKKWLAEQLEVSDKTMDNWTNDRTFPPADLLYKMATLLRCSVYDLYILDENIEVFPVSFPVHISQK
ncbi:helix-turn-helix transcriptional regulator [Priestia taiwanensis]|uniref:HTH cro/C1-type domain-containing protein n=1 Tax=Priestia taiwanensis TaxID=1347902 RepID=A0A917EP81_9BACI|nr:helix-turn-helix domain-containing protein [Priestia taiwanensis]GGE62119.1 hypothetical protein GCM10007140_10470 [Priestia taiwanensis]